MDYSITDQTLISLNVAGYHCRMTAEEVLNSDVMDGLDTPARNYVHALYELEQTFNQQGKHHD